MSENSQSEKATQKTILIIEDDANVGSSLVQIVVEETPYLAFLVTDPEQALEVFNDFVPDLLVIDYHLPHMNGMQLYDYLQTKREFTHTPTIIISAALPYDEIQQRHLIALDKPFDIDQLLTHIHNLLATNE
jgi:DNA-binding response OmpR family regulator